MAGRGTVHLDYTHKGRRRGSTQQVADYRVYATQPDDSTLRDTKKWRAWAETEWKKLKEGK